MAARTLPCGDMGDVYGRNFPPDRQRGLMLKEKEDRT